MGELYGIGPAQAHTLTPFGVHTIGILATLPESTVQRTLGGRTGRLLHERAKGIDRRAVVPTHLPYSTSAQRRFTIDTLDPTAVRAALLALAVELGDRLRNRQQTARTVTLTVTLGGHSQITRSHRLESGPSAHTDDLRQTLYDLYADFGTLPLPLGVAGHEGSTVIVGLNGLRLLREATWTNPARRGDA